MNQPDRTANRTGGASAHRLEDAIRRDLARYGEIGDGEVIVHYDLVAEVRRIDSDGTECIQRCHWSPAGSDPHLSYGMLTAQAAKIMDQLKGT